MICPCCGSEVTRKTELVFTSGAVFYNGRAIQLTVKERQFLFILANAPGVTKTVTAIFDALYEDKETPPASVKVVSVYACKVRRKLEQANFPYSIVTVRALGMSLQGIRREQITL